MANSMITLYRGCKALKDKNFVIEDIGDYLDTLDTYDIGNFQYIKNGLHISIKIDMSQNALDAGKLFDESYNYIKIIANNEDMVYYYFVDNRLWTSKNTITLELTQDVLNTYHEGRDYDLSEYTKIQRQHKDRLVNKHDVVKEGTSGTSITPSEWTTVGEYSFGAMTLVLEDAPDNVDLEFDISFVDRHIPYTYNYTKANKTLAIFLTSREGPMFVTAEVKWSYTVDRLLRKIDLQSEGITPQLYRDATEDKEIREVYDTDWYIVYKNKSQQGTETSVPVDAFLVPENNLQINFVGGGVNEIVPGDLESGKYYYFVTENVSFYKEENGDNILVGTSETHELFYYQQPMYYYTTVILYKENNTITVKLADWGVKPRTGKFNQFTKTETGITKLYVEGASDAEYHLGTTLTSNGETFTTYAKETWSFGTDSVVDLWGINSLNRTESELLKIIRLPYVPLNITVDSNNVVTLDGANIWSWDSGTHFIRLNVSSKIFDKTINALEPIDLYSELSVDDIDIDTNRDRDDKYESKLYHSDYYYNKFVYDSFGFPFALERIKTEALSDKSDIDFVVSSSITSRFMFRFPEYICKYATEDFSNILTIARNNETAIYNSAYLEYLRNGYNYDVKNKQSALNRSIGNILVSTGAGAVGGAIKGNYIGAAIGAVAGLASGLINTITSQADLERSIEQKLQQTKSQAVSVSESDDVELMTAYCNNRAKIVNYKCSEVVHNQLADLFYYCGYSVNAMGKPNMNSRYWFNFIQCEADIENPGNFNRDVLDNIKQKYAEGVTVLHNHNRTWDLEQEKENWEISIL